MIIGVPKEIKKHENRVALVPAGAEQLSNHGHKVLVEKNAGLASGFTDEAYEGAGATIIADSKKIWEQADMIVKVKEPLPEEYPLMRKDQLIFTYFHFASCEELTLATIKSGATAIAYETVEESDGSLPLLSPMSEVAGRIAVHEGAHYLHRANKGRGILIGGVPGTKPATVMVLGAGMVGTNAAKMASGLGALTYVLDINLNKLRYIADTMPSNVIPLVSNPENIRDIAKDADIIISGVLLPGAKAPKLITKDILKIMKQGSVIIDVAIDQGGSTETSRPTTHDDPVYIVDGIVHYCVANMPGAVPVTSTLALTNATWPYLRQIANYGFCRAIQNPAIARGVNAIQGHITCKAVSDAFNLAFTPLNEALLTANLCQL